MDIDFILQQLTLEEKALLIAGDDFWRTKSIDRLGLPSIMMCDGPHGLRKQIGEADHLGINGSIDAVCFPTAAGLAASFDRALMAKLGETLGNECQAEKIGMLLGPGLNIKRSPLCGRNFEYFSEDPCLTGELAAAYVNALQAAGVSTCAKHFAANNQETMRMTGDSVVEERPLHEIYLAGFETMVRKAHPHAMMCAYNQINGEYCSQNRQLLTDILRRDWGFEGCMVTDWGAVKDRVKGVDAGLDLQMPGPAGSNQQKVIRAVENGALSVEALDAAVRNVLTLVDWCTAHQNANAAFDREADHALAGQMAAECAVLLKNENSLLPLDSAAHAAFIGAFAETPRYQGSGSSHINSHRVTGALEAAAGRNVCYARGYDPEQDETDPLLLAEAVAAAKAAEVAVVFAGLPDRFESEGVDRSTLEIPANQNELIEAVAAANPNTVVVLHNGSPVTMPWLGQVAAVLEMYLGGENVGQATVALLYGETNPSGKLAETFPLRLQDNPSYLNFPGEEGRVCYREGIFVGYRYYDKKEMEVLFPFGHGLSYTQFAYSDLKLDKTAMDDTDTLTVTCRVQNTGSRAGKEVVQLYVRDLESSVIRPVRELKDFAKVELAPGEAKTVQFLLGKKAFAYYEPKIHSWHLEGGRFAVEIGASSRDLRLCGEVEIAATTELPVKFTAYSPMGQVLKSSRGQAALREVLQQMIASMPVVDPAESGLGAGSAAMMEQAMGELPLIALTAFGSVSEETIDQIVAALNG